MADLINVERLGEHTVTYYFDPQKHAYRDNELTELISTLYTATGGAAVIMTNSRAFYGGVIMIFCNQASERCHYYTMDLVDDIVVGFLEAHQSKPGRKCYYGCAGRCAGDDEDEEDDDYDGEGYDDEEDYDPEDYEEEDEYDEEYDDGR